jgi:membrane protein
MYEISAASGGGKITFGILATLWAASNGMGAITQALNVAYNVKESRPWWKQRLTAVSLTIALSVLIISALLIVLYGGLIADHIAGRYGFGDFFTLTWKIIQWPIALAFMLFSFALIYYFAPDLHEQKWTWVTPGSVIGVGLWLLISFGLRTYLQYFNSYSKTYGSLGAVIILMLWLYLTGVAILIGGEVNSDLEDLAARSGAPEAKEKGEKAPAEKSARRAVTNQQKVAAVTPTRFSQAPSMRQNRNGRPKLTLGTATVVLGAFCVSLLQRLTRRRTTISRNH